jgi:hypothetical protein
VCTGTTGTLKRNPIVNPQKRTRCVQSGKSVLMTSLMLKLSGPSARTPVATMAASRNALPTAVKMKNLTAARTRSGPPQ